MYKFLVICAVLALIAMAGCPSGTKKSGDAEAVRTTAAPTGSADQAGDPEMDEKLTSIEDWKAETGVDETPFTEEELTMIRESLIEIGPDFKYSYEAASEMVQGPGLPPEGLAIDLLADKVGQQIRRKKAEFSESMVKNLCRGIYQELLPPEVEESRADTGKQTADSRPGRIRPGGGSAEDGDTSAAPPAPRDDGLVAAESAIGLWKSIREENPRITTNHNDDYFDFLELWHDGRAMYKVFRKRALASEKPFTYTYQARTGRVKLLDAKGQVMMEMTLRMAEGDADTLYMQRDNEDSMLVFTRVGSGQPEAAPDPGSAGLGTSQK